MRNHTIQLVFCGLCLLTLLLSACKTGTEEKNTRKKYYVAAYVWPSCHNDSMAQEKLWSEGMGEWEIIKKGTPRFKGHYQPREPLWGYQMDDNPAVWEKKIDLATEHHVNTFIFDWYWFDGQPFLDGSVNAFLKAPNSDKMNFYLMWANHDVPGSMWNPYRYTSDSILWNGTVDWPNFRIIVERIIRQYFKQPNYFTIDGEPVFSVYHTANLIKSFGGLDGTRKALDYFREETVKAGFSGLHVQLVGSGTADGLSFWGDSFDVNNVIKALNISSITMYNMAGSASRKEDYVRYGEDGIKMREKWNSTLKVPLFPCVSVGWDDTPRYPQKGQEDVIHLYNTPQNFANFLDKAKEYADEHPEQPPLIVINAWNEWVEGSYLEPDRYSGYGFLGAVKEVMEGKQTQEKVTDINHQKETFLKDTVFARAIEPETGAAKLKLLQANYASKEDFEQRKTDIRKAMFYQLGLDPMPKRTSLNPIVNGKQTKNGYTIENVGLEILPGVWTYGNLYRPTNGKNLHPAVMLAHGHSPLIQGEFRGRFMPVQQTIAASLAKMGAVVFCFDMFGYGESALQLGLNVHRTGLAQTMNVLGCISVLDYLTSLPDVDKSRIGITGASGGGTQSFLTAALDDRITVSVPVVQVSCFFPGGCPCESGRPIHISVEPNTNNAEIAAMAVPRPMLVVSDGGDWTRTVDKVEFPFIQSIYSLYGKKDLTGNVHLPDEGHDYGPNKRIAMYDFMSKHLGLNKQAILNTESKYDESFLQLATQESLMIFPERDYPIHSLRTLSEIYDILRKLQH